MTLLFVCTGNQCRSPMAAGLASQALKGRPGEATVASAGFNGDGVPSPAEAVAVMGAVGFDLAAHRSRILTLDLVEAADLVITMTRQQLIGTITLAPQEWERCFTLVNLVARAEVAGPRPEGQSVRAWAQFLGAGRARAGLLQLPADDDIPDPMGGRKRDYERTRQRLAGLIDRLIPLLGAG